MDEDEREIKLLKSVRLICEASFGFSGAIVEDSYRARTPTVLVVGMLTSPPFILRLYDLMARLAQLVERKALNLVVVGSSPTYMICMGIYTNKTKVEIIYNE
ncbi:unnamed protein product [Sphenostylis stenocarpa]|uniref:Uncharacterized protein n=1 Tax=Sphenostylis stenocarpa TaxID=92480 RepID=A0AA86VJQ7_9FABA|nr:unnamed protein product [Sphenostylis stenocarpa]